MTPTIAPELRERMDARAITSLRAHKDTWLAHAAANRGRVRRQVSQLWKDANTKTGVLVAAGPSLAASLPEILALDRSRHEVVAVDMALSFLLKHGVVPDYVICSDASPAIARTLEVELAGAGLPLLLNVVVHPETAKAWKGPVYWFAMMSNVYDKDAGAFMQDTHQQASGGVSAFLVPGGNVGSLGLSFLLGVRAVPKVLLYGHDFCWTDETRFYCGGVAADLAAERIRSEKESGTVVAMQDALGQPVWTNASLLYFMGWYADQMRRFPGAIENRTPTTILDPGGIA